MHDNEPAAGQVEGLPPRDQIEALIQAPPPPPRHTLAGWRSYLASSNDLSPAARLTPAQFLALPEARRSGYDDYRRITNANLPLQTTPTWAQAADHVMRCLRINTMQVTGPHMGVILRGEPGSGTTTLACSVAARFEQAWFRRHLGVSADPEQPECVPVVYVPVPVQVTAQSLCQSILGFLSPAPEGDVPRLIGQVVERLSACRVQVLVLDDADRLDRARDGDDVTELICHLMSCCSITVVLVSRRVPLTGPGLPVSPGGPFGRPAGVAWDAGLVSGGTGMAGRGHRFVSVGLDRFRFTTRQDREVVVRYLWTVQEHLRLLAATDDMLASGSMPEYLMRRSNGVPGVLNHLIEDAAILAMDSGVEAITEDLLDEIPSPTDDTEDDGPDSAASA